MDYIHLNPARAGLAGSRNGPLVGYKWSSLPSHQKGNGPDWLVMDRVLRTFELTGDGRGRRAYVAWLEAHHGVALEEAALRAAVEWSIRYLPDFRMPDKALDLVDQACAAVRFATLSPQKRRDRLSLPRAGTGSPSHLTVGREEIAAAVAARCGIPVGTLTADEGARLMALEGDLGRRVA